MFFLSRVDSVASRNRSVMSFQRADQQIFLLVMWYQALTSGGHIGSHRSQVVLSYFVFSLNRKCVGEKTTAATPCPIPSPAFCPCQRVGGGVASRWSFRVVIKLALETHKGTEFFHHLSLLWQIS